MKNTGSTGSVVQRLLRHGSAGITFFPGRGVLAGLVCLMLQIIFCVASHAQEVNPFRQVEVTNQDNEVVFVLNIYPQGQGGSNADFAQTEIDALTNAVQYWVDVLKPTGKMPSVLDADGNVVNDADGDPVTQPVVIHVAKNTTLINNAGASTLGYVKGLKDDYNVALGQMILADGGYNAGVNGEHSSVVIGTGYVANPDNPSTTGHNNDLTAVMIHEIGHSLGVAAAVETHTDPDTRVTTYQFSDVLSRWNARLRDNNGNPARPGQVLDHNEQEGVIDEGIFEMGDQQTPLDIHEDAAGNPSHPTFVGENVLTLMYDKPLNELTEYQKSHGVAIQGYTYGYGPNYPGGLQWIYNGSGTLSHFNTENTRMSWQAFRNYPGFIEIELAALQDIGYDIERKAFFGKSFYVNGNGETPYYNTKGFSYWDYNAQSYIQGKANESIYAIGVHLFANDLFVVQQADVLADGGGSAGIRIDGTNNKLTIAEGTTIATNGLNGVGVLAAYGKDHTIVHRGRIEAQGAGGIGVDFNFGEYKSGQNRGSYYYGYLTTEPGEIILDIGFLPELYGPLVKNFDVTGTIIGSKTTSTATYDEIDGLNRSWVESREFHMGAAIHIDQTAHVESINIMNGAKIDGDILSFFRGTPYTDLYPAEWISDANGNPTDLAISLMGKYAGLDLGTTITFGHKANAGGGVTEQVDKDFNFVYKDNINFIRFELFPNIRMHQEDGTIIPWSPDYDGPLGDDWFWRLIARDFGFTDYHDFGDCAVMISREDEYRVFAEVVPSGVIDLKFVGGKTEFQGNTVYVRSLEIGQGATLTLTAGQDDPTKTPQINIYSDFDPQGLPDHNSVNLDPQTNPHPNPPTMYNYGRLSGNGTFRLGQRIMGWDGDFQEKYGVIGHEVWHWEGTVDNRGTIAPGDNDGAGIGTISIVGDLKFGRDSVYEMTIGRVAKRDENGNLLDEKGNYIQENGMVVDRYGNYIKVRDKDGNWVNKKADAIYVEGNDLIKVSGETTLGGTLKIQIAPDSIFANESTTYTIIESGSFTSGTNFTNFENEIGFLRFGQSYINPSNSKQLQVTIDREMDYFTKRGKTFNELSVARAIDNSVFESPMIAFSLGDRRNSDANLRDMYNRIGASIRANSALINLWNPSEMIFNRIGYGNGQMETGNRGRVDWNRIRGRKERLLGQSPYSMRSGSFWGDAIHTSFDAESDGNGGDYDFSRTGFMIGGEWNLTPYSAIGAIAAYTDGKLKQSGDQVKSDDYILGLYFVCAPFNEFELKTYIGLGFQEYDMDRRIYNADIYNSVSGGRGIDDRYKSSTKGNSFNFSVELTRPLMLHPTFILRPTLGVDAQHIWQNGFTENDFDAWSLGSLGSNLYALQFDRMHYDRILFRAGFSSETSGFRGGIRMRAFYVTNVGGDNFPTSEATFAGGGAPFTIRGTDLGRNYLNLGVGANLWLDGEKTSSLFFDYDSNIYNTSKKVYVHSISAGFVQNF